MKKFIAIACILVMCLGIMAGCMEKVEDTVDPNALVGVTLVYGETKIEVNAGQWEPKRTQIKTVDVSLGTTKEYSQMTCSYFFLLSSLAPKRLRSKNTTVTVRDRSSRGYLALI